MLEEVKGPRRVPFYVDRIDALLNSNIQAISVPLSTSNRELQTYSSGL